MRISFSNEFEVNGLGVFCDVFLEEGKTYQLIGENGVGKSSFIHYLKLNMDMYFEGIVVRFIDQQRLTPLNRISLSELLKTLDPQHSTKIEFPSEFKNKISKFKDIPINDLSGGQNQLVKIFLALHLGGDLFILDEPFQFLDKENSILFKKILMELKGLGRTILIVEHKDEIISSLVDCKFEIKKEDNFLVIR